MSFGNNNNLKFSGSGSDTVLDSSSCETVCFQATDACIVDNILLFINYLNCDFFFLFVNIQDVAPGVSHFL